MTRFTIFFILISSICFGQKSYHGKIKPLLDSTNYIDNSIRIEIINYLDSLKITPANYFIDSAVIIKGDTLYIYILDSIGLKRLDEFAEKKKDKSKRQILPNGNPGNFMTISYHVKKRKIFGHYFDQ